MFILGVEILGYLAVKEYWVGCPEEIRQIDNISSIMRAGWGNNVGRTSAGFEGEHS